MIIPSPELECEAELEGNYAFSESPRRHDGSCLRSQECADEERGMKVVVCV